MGKTTIGWTDHSINPIRARRKVPLVGQGVWHGRGHYCEKISPGCTKCYSSRFQPRFGMPEFGAGQHLDQIEPFLDIAKLEEVLRRKKPTRYFWCDMTDLFGAWVPDWWIDQCFAVMALTPWHTHQVLTKRADRMRQWFERWPDGAARFHHVRFQAYALLMAQRKDGSREWNSSSPECVRAAAAVDGRWPLPNAWLGVSVENQECADTRIPELLQTPASVRFLSVEPLLGPVDLGRLLVKHTGYAHPGLAETSFNALTGTGTYPSRVTGIPIEVHGHGIDWVIVGGESGCGARPCEVRWVESIVDQCRGAETACFVKQLGADPRWAGAATTPIEHARGKGDDPALWPEALRVQEFPQVP